MYRMYFFRINCHIFDSLSTPLKSHFTFAEALDRARPWWSKRKQRTEVVPKSTEAISFRPVDDDRFEVLSPRLLAILRKLAYFFLWQEKTD